MVTSRLAVFIGMLAIAMIAVQADAALSSTDGTPGALSVSEPNFLLVLLLAALVAFATTAGRSTAPIQRRRVNRARARARRTGG